MLWLQNCLNKTAEDREEDGENVIEPQMCLIEMFTEGGGRDFNV